MGYTWDILLFSQLARPFIIVNIGLDLALRRSAVNEATLIGQATRNDVLVDRLGVLGN